MATESYVISTDFVALVADIPNATILTQQWADSAITEPLLYVVVDEDDDSCEFEVASALTGGDITALDALVAAHTGTETGYPPDTVTGNVFTVATDGSGMFTDIQDAADAAPSGTLILLSPEVHTITSSLTFANPGCTVMGMGSGLSYLLTPGAKPMAQIEYDAGAAAAPTLVTYGAQGQSVTFCNVKLGLTWDGAPGNTAAIAKAVTGGGNIQFVGCYFAFDATVSTTGGTAIDVWANGGDVTFHHCAMEVGGTGVGSLDLFRGVYVDAECEVRAHDLTCLGALASFLVNHASAECWIRDCDIDTLYVNAADLVHLESANKVTNITDVVGGNIDYNAQGLYLARGAEWWVSKDGNDNNPGTSPELPFLTIGAAIAAATDGDIVYIMPGEYPEELHIDGGIGGANLKNIALVGLGTGLLSVTSAKTLPQVIINPTMSDDGDICLEISGELRCSFTNIVFEPVINAVGSYSAIDLGTGVGAVTFDSCYIRPLVSPGGTGSTTGVFAWASAKTHFHNCVFRVADGASQASFARNFDQTGGIVHLHNCTLQEDAGAADGECRVGSTAALHLYGTIIEGPLTRNAGGTVTDHGGNSWVSLSGFVDDDTETNLIKATTGKLQTDGLNDLYKLYLRSITSDPGTLSDGMVWYRSDTDNLHVRENGITETVALASDLAGGDTDAIHDNVAGEIAALGLVSAASGDHVLIEDATDSNNKKRVNANDFLGGGSPPTLSKSITIESPGASEDLSMFFTPVAITITEIRAVLRGSATPSVTWTLRHSTDRSAAGNEVVTGGTVTTSITTGSDVTAFDDATIPADSFVWVETTAQSGTVDAISITPVYTED